MEQPHPGQSHTIRRPMGDMDNANAHRFTIQKSPRYITPCALSTSAFFCLLQVPCYFSQHRSSFRASYRSLLPIVRLLSIQLSIMLPFLAAVLLLLELPLFARARITTADDMGILQLVTPTTHASLVPTETVLRVHFRLILFFADSQKARPTQR